MRPVDLAVGFFPDRAKAVRRLYLQDEQFRSICEGLLLAQASLLQFEGRADADAGEKVEDFRNVLQELKAELRAYLDASGRYGASATLDPISGS